MTGFGVGSVGVAKPPIVRETPPAPEVSSGPSAIWLNSIVQPGMDTVVPLVLVGVVSEKSLFSNLNPNIYLI